MFASSSARALTRASRLAMAKPAAAGLSLLVCLMLGACAGPLPRSVAAADRQSSSPAIAYRPALSGYEAARPVEPMPWRERNDAVAPKEKAQ
jgi:hypothetical protein